MMNPPFYDRTVCLAEGQQDAEKATRIKHCLAARCQDASKHPKQHTPAALSDDHPCWQGIRSSSGCTAAVWLQPGHAEAAQVLGREGQPHLPATRAQQ